VASEASCTPPPSFRMPEAMETWKSCDQHMQQTNPTSVRTSVRKVSNTCPNISNCCQIMSQLYKNKSQKYVRQVSEPSPKSVGQVSNKCQQIVKTCPTSVKLLSNKCQTYCPTSVKNMSKLMSTNCPKSIQQETSVSNVGLQFADAYVWHLLVHLIIPELEALSPLFRLPSSQLFSKVCPYPLQCGLELLYSNLPKKNARQIGPTGPRTMQAWHRLKSLPRQFVLSSPLHC
jgi:hypothetical protein